MGVHEVTQLDDCCSQAFEQALLNDLEALGFMLRQGLIADDTRRIGAEQELFLVDSNYRPSPCAPELIPRLNNPLFTTEIGKFNLELNLPPSEFSGECFSQMESELNRLLDSAKEAARDCGARILLAGTLPTVHQYHLSLENLTTSPRYVELNRMMTLLRGPSYLLHIMGIDELRMVHDNVMPEACCTSFQVHLQVTPQDFAPVYNIAQLVSAPVLAATANSPLLLGQRLWRETRIALFQNSVDERSISRCVRGDPARVSFGEGWVQSSALEVFREEVARFRVLMTTNVQEDSLESLRQGRIPQLQALHLHNSTVWRWNRPCYGVMDGKAHLRIEARAMPAGPTVLDQIANAAFLLGLLEGIPERYGDIKDQFPFEFAKNNFFLAARYGLQARFDWIGGRRIAAPELILKELLPLAREGLKRRSVSTQDVDRYLGIIAARVHSERTGSEWALRSLAAMGKQGSREAKHRFLTACALANQASGQPVHLWPLATLLQSSPAIANTVEDCMSTDLFTVRPGDLVRLAANVMDWRRISHVPVEDDQGRLVGLVTKRALVHLLAEKGGDADPGGILVRDLMVSDPKGIPPEMSLQQAISEMTNAETDCLLVVVSGRLVGIVTIHDLIRSLATLLAQPPEARAALKGG
jgi:CBS domain-containing protein/gamma-glutamyl:cysteine ligase YbdK (ATP-grasp superfamily)